MQEGEAKGPAGATRSKTATNLDFQVIWGQASHVFICIYIFLVQIWISSESRKTRPPAAWGIKGLSQQGSGVGQWATCLTPPAALQSTVVRHLKVCLLCPPQMELRKLVTAWWWCDPQLCKAQPPTPMTATRGALVGERRGGPLHPGLRAVSSLSNKGPASPSPAQNVGACEISGRPLCGLVGPCPLLPQGTLTSLARRSYTLLCYCNSLDGQSSPPPTSPKRARPVCPYSSQAEPKTWCTSDTQDC